MKSFFLVLLVAGLGGFLDAETVIDRSVPDGLYQGHYKWLDRPDLKNIQLALQEVKWIGQDLNTMESQIETLVKKKATIFEAEQDLRSATDSAGYAYASD